MTGRVFFNLLFRGFLLNAMEFFFFFPQHENRAQGPKSKLAWLGIMMLLLSLVVLQ